MTYQLRIRRDDFPIPTWEHHSSYDTIWGLIQAAIRVHFFGNPRQQFMFVVDKHKEPTDGQTANS